MQFELSHISIIISIILGIFTYSNTKARVIRQDSSDIVTVIVKLENIGKDISEIKSDLKNVRSEVKANANRITVIEKDIEYINGRLEHYEESCKDCRDKNNLK